MSAGVTGECCYYYWQTPHIPYKHRVACKSQQAAVYDRKYHWDTVTMYRVCGAQLVLFRDDSPNKQKPYTSAPDAAPNFDILQNLVSKSTPAKNTTVQYTLEVVLINFHSMGTRTFLPDLTGNRNCHEVIDVQPSAREKAEP